jgi:ABC-type sugar transport system ATPase subunit
MVPDAPLLSARGIHKRFGATYALQGVDFDLRAGEMHALIGANGAGKSTLSRILAGLIRPDSGTISILGQELHFAKPREALDAGVTLVTQETSLATHMSALENIFLPELGKRGRLDWRKLRQRALKLIDDLSIDVGFALDDEVATLSMANRQLVEILKVLAIDSKVIFLDEPTTSLSPFECDRLLELTKRLAAKGHGLVLVTHRLEEIFSFTDRMTVLREGKLVASGVDTATTDQNGLIRMMVGRELQDVYSVRESPVPSEAETALSVRNLAVGDLVRDVSFSVRRGEIVGLGGLVGAGRTETVEAIFGLTKFDRGTLELFGKPFAPKTPRAAIEAGIGFVGEDRRRHGLIPDFGVRENLMLVHLSMQSRIGLDYKSVLPRAEELVRGLGLDPARLDDPDILKFSGGMQQKIIMARWLLAGPRLLILDEPTRGVDIETRSAIYRSLRKIASEGTAIIVVSSDFEELLGISNRVAVISDGRSVADVPSAYLNIEKLTMLAAPRSSAGQIGVLLKGLADRYSAEALWVHEDQDHLFCFECARHKDAPVTMDRGAFMERSSAALDLSSQSTVSALVRGKRGQGLGNLMLIAAPTTLLPSQEELDAAVRRVLYPIAVAA